MSNTLRTIFYQLISVYIERYVIWLYLTKQLYWKNYMLLDASSHSNYCLYRYLHANKLNGSIPPELGQMTKLHYLYVNFLTSTLGCISLVVNCTYDFFIRRMVPFLFSPVRNVQKNEFLCLCRELNDNHLTGHIPPELGKLTDLYDL